MLSAQQVLDEYFLDTRCMLLEIAATLDRHDASVEREEDSSGGGDPRLEKLYQSLTMLADQKIGPNRAEKLLWLFSDPVE